MSVSYQIWDVFTSRALAGNPLAVVPRAEGLGEGWMQKVAREFNLSETSFVTARTATGARARYFTPARELPMAGHPSIGTVYALDRLGEVPGESFTLGLAAGPKRMRLEREGRVLTRVWMNQGAPELGEVYEDRAQVAAALGLERGELEPELPVQLGSAGVPFLYVPVVSLGALARAQVTRTSLTALMNDDNKAVFVFTLRAEDAQVRARMLGLALGVVEDPATGSAHGPLGAYLAAHGALSFTGGEARFVSRQGVEMGRPSEIHVRVCGTPQAPEVEVGGSAALVAEGKLLV